MLKNKFWFLLALAACAPQTPDKIVTGKWLEGRAQFVPSRIPAAGPPAASCRSELFTLEEVKREALHYEAQLESEQKINGTWKHLRLNQLPVAQAKFLKAVGTKFGDLTEGVVTDVSACEDAPCIVNTVYRSVDGLEGWATYLWYLKMGNVLSFKNKVFEQADARPGVYKGVSYPLTDYLFSRNELYAFWRMSHALPTVFKTIADLKEIQRVPRKSSIEGREGNTCGLAYSQGFIILNDGCLTFGLTNDNGFIYEGTTHEMAHQIDFQWGKRDNVNSFYYSDNGPWAEVGGWSMREYWDEATRKTIREWSSTLTDAQFVRSYARTSPVEHFADTAAYYRYDGENTKRKIPAPVYTLLKSSVFEQLDYDPVGLMSQFESESVKMFTNEVFQSVANCSKDATTPNTVVPLPEASFPFAVSLPERRCLASKLKGLVDQAVVEAKLQHVDGCRILRVPQRVSEFKQKIEATFLAQMIGHIRAARESEDYFNRLNEFYRNLDQKVLPLRLMAGCYGELNERECYQDAVSDLLDELIPADVIQAETMQTDLRRMFLEANRFETVKMETIKVHQDFLFTQSALISDSVHELWQTCLAVPLTDHDSPVAGPLSLGAGWMASSQYNCLNRDIAKETRSVVGGMSFDQLGVTDGKEGKLLYDLALPIYVREIKQLYEDALAAESALVTKTLEESSQLFEQKLKGDFSWARRPNSLQSDCESEALKNLPNDFRYHKRSEVFTPRARLFCQQLLQSAEFATWMSTQQVFVEQQVLNHFVSRIQVKSDERVAECLEKYPIGNIFQSVWNKKKCRRCYLDEWEQLETVAWGEALTAANTQLPIERSTLRGRVSYRIEQIQEDVHENKCKSNSLGIRLGNPF